MVKIKNILDELICLKKHIYKIKFMQIFETQKSIVVSIFTYLYINMLKWTLRVHIKFIIMDSKEKIER